MPGLFKRLHKKVQDWQIAWNSSFGTDISTPAARREARRHANIVDHAFLRRIWANMHDLGGGAWRSNQPGPERFARLGDMGIRSIINLRGASAFAVYLFEREACEQHGITLIDHPISAYSLSPAEQYLGLLELFDTVERPFLMHCKSGADRSGLAAAMYLIDQRGAPVAEAARQLSLRYLHRRGTRAGVLDYLLAAYDTDNRASPVSLRDWLATRYDREALQAGFDAARKAGKGR